MIRYYCNTCGASVGDLTALVDITSRLSSRTRDEWRDAGLYQEHVCKKCVHAIKHFITTLGKKATPPINEQQEVSTRIQ